MLPALRRRSLRPAYPMHRRVDVRFDALNSARALMQL
jgi:hypothetical protein